MDTTKSLGLVVKAFRSLLGLSQSQLADRSGLDQTYITNIETGKNSNPTREKLNKLAKGLNLHAGVLLFLSMDLDNVDNEKKEIYLHLIDTIKENLSTLLLNSSQESNSSEQLDSGLSLLDIIF